MFEYGVFLAGVAIGGLIGVILTSCINMKETIELIKALTSRKLGPAVVPDPTSGEDDEN